VVLSLQLSGTKPLGVWPGVWGLAACIFLYVVISAFTRAPAEKAEAFIGYLEKNLQRYRFI
jgi:SSS family solute:Na+ symporter